MTIEKTASVLSGEIAVLTPHEAEQADVDFAPGFDLEALKKVDEDPFFATVRIKPGRGDQGKGPEYGIDVLRSIEEQINSSRPPGYKGHQHPDNVEWEYREPVTAWVGAKLQPTEDGQGELIVKGYVPPTAGDLRTQLKLAESGADVVNSVSIFGVRGVEGDQVKTFDLWSLDWTPKGRNGMQTELLKVSGEQAKEDDDMALSRDEIIASLKADEVPEHLVESIRKEALEGVSGKAALADEVRSLLGLSEEDADDKVIERIHEFVVSEETEELEKAIEEVLDEKVEAKAEMARAAVKDAVLPRLKGDSTKEEIAGEIDSALEKPYIEALTKGDTFPVFSGGTGETEGSRQGTHWE